MEKQKIKVVHVTSRLNVGGLSQQVLALCTGMDGDGFECTLVTGQTGEGEGDMLRFVPAPKRLHRIPELGRAVRPFADLIAFWKLLRFLRASRPDVVHNHASKAGALGRVAAFLAGVPVRVHSFHGHVFHGYFSLMASAAIVLAERMLGWITTAVVLPCESQRREIAERFRVVPAGKTRVVRYGIPVDHYARLPQREEARRRLGLHEGALMVGTIGRMAPVKNHRLLVEAFARLPTAVKGRPVELLLFGDGECRPEVEEQVRALGLASRTHFLGWQEDLRWAYAAMDVLALTSRNEGMPIAALEAMASGVPVVSMAVGGVADLVEDGKTGLLVEEQEAGAFARKLGALVGDEGLRRRLAKEAREGVRQRHDQEELVRNTRRLYRDLVGERAPESRSLPRPGPGLREGSGRGTGGSAGGRTEWMR